jgi:hypothetical protein
MNLSFTYNTDKDIWCILNKGKSSINSPAPTKVYEQLAAEFGENPTPRQTKSFVETYISTNNINVDEFLITVREDWKIISEEFQRRAERIFGVSLTHPIVVYLTINNRCPYSIEDNYFYISVQTVNARKTIMHELWHFYTWYAIGLKQEEMLGRQRYNDLKESLTVLLNLECVDLLPPGVIDIGYHQHKEMRNKIVDFWENNKNIDNLWEYLAKQGL